MTLHETLHASLRTCQKRLLLLTVVAFIASCFLLMSGRMTVMEMTANVPPAARMVSPTESTPQKGAPSTSSRSSPPQKKSPPKVPSKSTRPKVSKAIALTASTSALTTAVSLQKSLSTMVSLTRPSSTTTSPRHSPSKTTAPKKPSSKTGDLKDPKLKTANDPPSKSTSSNNKPSQPARPNEVRPKKTALNDPPSRPVASKSHPPVKTLPPDPFARVASKPKGKSGADNQTKTFKLTLSTMKAPKMDPAFKNPCWHTADKHLTMCIPYIFLIGFPKCGTTDLHARLLGHPLVIPGIKKEPHFFSRVFYKRRGFVCNGEVDCATAFYSQVYYHATTQFIKSSNDIRMFWKRMTEDANYGHMYWSHAQFAMTFANESLAILELARQRHKYPVVTIDSSASTAWDYVQWQEIAENDGLDRPAYTTADWLRRVNPNVKIIITLREPVARAYSDYVYVRRRRATVPKFHKHVNSTVKRLNACFKEGIPPLICTNIPTPARLAIGLYHLHIKHWLDVFPRDQILILRFEDYKNNSSRILDKVFRFLDLVPVSKEGREFILRTKALNVNPIKKRLGDMYPETQDILTKFYEPHNKKLAKLLGDDRFLWKD